MNKQAFLEELRKGLSGLPKKDIDERLIFYCEMIDDRMEDGIPEEAAVREIGNIEEIVPQIIADIPLGKIIKEKMMPKKTLNTWEVILFALGSPIWLSLLIAVFSVFISLYVASWSVMVALWSVFASFAVCGLVGIAAGVFLAVGDNGLTGVTMIGAGMACARLSVFLFFGCKAATKGLMNLTRKHAIRVRTCFIHKEEA